MATLIFSIKFLLNLCVSGKVLDNKTDFCILHVFCIYFKKKKKERLQNTLGYGNKYIIYNFYLISKSGVGNSGLPDPLFRIRPEPDPDFFFQIKIRPEPDPDLFFKLISGRNRIRSS